MRERHKRASVRVSKDKVTKKEESCLNLTSLPESQFFWGSHSTPGHLPILCNNPDKLAHCNNSLCIWLCVTFLDISREVSTLSLHKHRTRE